MRWVGTVFDEPVRFADGTTLIESTPLTARNTLFGAARVERADRQAIRVSNPMLFGTDASRVSIGMAVRCIALDW